MAPNALPPREAVSRSAPLIPRPVPDTVDATLDLLARGRYVADRSLATALFLALRLKRPLFLEGEAGVGAPVTTAQTSGRVSPPATIVATAPRSAQIVAP